jgi:ribosome biogenesis GTPase
MTGKILKGVGGFYTVRDAEGKEYECRACGRFRVEGETPLPGDDAEFSPETAYIERILPRRSELKRPRVANVDAVAIIVSAGKPKVDALLVDKLIISARRNGVFPLLVINQCDTVPPDAVKALVSDYRSAVDIVCVSARTGFGLEELRSRLAGHCVCLAGQSAAGKSSLLNAMFPGLALNTGGLSKKTDRGRHTTRHAELLAPEGFSGTVVDTPGFSFFESDEIEPETLWNYCADFKRFGGACRYPSCLHAGEPECGVAEAVRQGKISLGRYERYLEILQELKEKRDKKYD